MSTETRTGDWVQTYTGRGFYPLDPRVEDIDPIDIAHALSLLCRYGGHVSRFYSVAEHCVLMSQAVSPENALWALLHDATEAYVGDVVRPLKQMLPDYIEIEKDLMAVICRKYGLTLDMPEEVYAADTRILLDEKKVLMTGEFLPWDALQGMEPLSVFVNGWDPKTAEQEYLNRLEELT